MDEHEWLTERFEEHRTRLRAVAYRMLGSPSEADDAVQEAWLRAVRSGTGGVENLSGWLTTVVARVCLNMLRSRRLRREDSLERPLGARVPDPIVGRADAIDPEHEALLADSVGLAPLMVLDTLSPAERLAFVLHDMFAVPFGEIAPAPWGARRPRRGSSPAGRAAGCGGRPRSPTPTSPASEKSTTPSSPPRAAVTSTRSSWCSTRRSFSEPTMVPCPRAHRRWSGGRAVAEQALTYSRFAPFARPALVNGAAGVVTAPGGEPLAVMGFTVTHGKIVEIDILADPERLRRLDLLAGLDD